MVKANRGGDGLTRSSKRNERVGDLTRTCFTRSSQKNTPCLTRSSTKSRITDDHTRSLKKNKRSYPARSTKDKPICNGEKAGLPISVHGDGLNEDRFGDLESLGYPERPETMLTDFILANSFEEPFGDTHGRGVWSELSKTVAVNIHENTVALASFNGEKRFFACTGFFIEWNGCTTILTSASLIRHSRRADEILKNLTIEVLLPSKKRAAGILQHYNLHYNIALVRVNDYCPSHPIKIQHRRRDNREVLAVGRIFTSGELMASRGQKASMLCEHDCKYLRFSKCRISKAGIGGPLLDFDGKFVGMNFYDKHAGGTWYLTWEEIFHVLGHFEKKRTVDEAGHDDYASNKLDWTIDGDHSVIFNRWFVPLPFWCRPYALKRYGPKMPIRNLTRDVELTQGSWEM